MTRSANGNSAKEGQKVVTTPIAVIGVGAIFPKAQTAQTYWENILKKIDCITDIPASRWSIEDYYDPDPLVPDKTYCKRGAFIPDIDFDPMEFGLPPNILEVTDVSQLLSLVVARDALDDAGYGEDRQFDREHTGVVLGAVGMSSKLFSPLMNRLQYPVWTKVLRSAGVSEADTAKIVEKIKLAYVGWEENAFPGAIGNVIAGRICNRFDLGGTNCVVDAACGSSLAAVHFAVEELIERRANMMITGGVDADNTINTYMCFSKTPAFSKSDRVRTFDADSDGMMVGEGIGMVVLKRLADAERDGDRVYAVIKAIGTSSDGRFKSIYAPRPSGQAMAVRRAYEEAGFDPKTVGLIEAHGTGTMAGDPAEVSGIGEVFGADNPRKQHIALGSVKSQVGHTKAAAGVAGLIKVSLALYHKILPPTINVSKPNPKFNIENTAFYINTETRPWIRAKSSAPRRAGVSSFGFGGTNFHVVLEESQPEQTGAYRFNGNARGILLAAQTPADLAEACRKELAALQGDGASVRFAQLVNASRALVPDISSARVGFAAENIEEARQALQLIIDSLAEKPAAESWENPKGIYYRKSGMETQGKVVALFSGQGSQYLDMGRELAVNFPTFREVYGSMDELFLQDGLEPLSSRVYPRPVFDQKDRDALSDTLTRTEHAQPAIGAFSVSLFKLLQDAGLKADFTAGHSFGELTALWAGGVLSEEDYYKLAKARGKAMKAPDDPAFDAGTMMAVKGDVEKVRSIFANDAEVTLANWNSHNQVVIAGAKAALARAKQTLESQGFGVVPLPVSAAFHTHLVGHAQKPFAQVIRSTRFNPPAVKVYANGTAQPHSDDPKEIQTALEKHILNPVLFRDEILNIYTAGGRVFIEFGPKSVLTSLVGNILEGKPHLAVALNASPKKDSDRQLREAVLALRVAGLPLASFDRFERALSEKQPRKKSPVTVKLNGGLYMTEKTRKAFENALNDGFKVSSAMPQPSSHSNGNGKAAAEKPAETPPAQATVPAAPASTQPPVVDPTTFDRLLAEFQSHQGETLRLHEQYLRMEEEYARAFAHLTQLQTELVSKGSSAPGELQSVIPLFESLERSMARFHEHQEETLRVHQNYLEAQERFSQAYIQGISQASTGATLLAPAFPTPRAAAAPAPASVAAPVVAPAVKAAPAPVKAAVPAAPPPAPKTEPKPTPAPAPVAAPVAAPAPAIQGAGTNAEKLTQALLAIVSEKTGYPAETLELGMDMEADLGIDSIKRVEILGAMQSQFPELPKPDAAELAELRTLGQIVDHLGKGLAAAAPQATQPLVAAAPAAPAPAQPAAVATTSAAGADQVGQALLAIVSEKTGYPVETLEPDMDMEADLGIDSIKRVEILGAIQTQFPELPKPDAAALAELRTLRQITEYLSAGAPAPSASAPQAAPVAAPTPTPAAEPAQGTAPSTSDAGKIGQALLAVVSEKTGYPVETLEPDMDMEADLGIDSIKRVEILGAIQTQFPELPKPDAAALAELRTLRQITAYLSAAPASLPPSQPVEEQPRPFDPGVEQGVVRRKLLPPPDAIDFALPAGSTCLVTDDGAGTAVELVRSLSALGWKLVVLRFPQAVAASQSVFAEGVPVMTLEDLSEGCLQATLAEAARLYGPPAAFVHLAPATASHSAAALDFPETERALVKLVFLAAKHLKSALNEAAEKGRAAFATVTRLDGEFGLGEAADYAPTNGGLFGLVKTLNLEWDHVYCKAIDLSPAIDADCAAKCIVAELCDPNRLVVEVGYNASRERSTLTIEPVPVTGGKL